MRITDIIIRAEVDGKWGDYDIGDPKLSNEQILDWLNKQAEGLGPDFYKRVILTLLNRQSWANMQNEKSESDIESKPG